MIIYKITNKINGKVYIGQTIKNKEDRWRDHVYKSEHGGVYAISNAIRKYGKDNFNVELISRCDNIKQLNQREVKYIQLYNSLCPSGYNIEIGGKNKILHQSTKDKISKTLKGRKRKKSSILKQMKTRKERNIAPPTLGVKFSEKFKQQKRDELLNRIKNGQHPAKGVKHSDISKRNMAIASGAKEFVVQKKDGSHIGFWVNQSKCARDLGLNRANISEILLGNTNRKSHKGYLFKYSEVEY